MVLKSHSDFQYAKNIIQIRQIVVAFVMYL